MRFSIVCLREALDSSDVERLKGMGVTVDVLQRGGLRRFASFYRLVRAARPDVIHAVLFDANMLARLVAPLTRTPVLSSLVTAQYDQMAMDAAPSRWKKTVVRLTEVLTGWFGVTHFHAVSESVASHAVRRLHIDRRKITVVERGRDGDALGRRSAARTAATRHHLGVAEGEQVVLAVARHEPPKGLHCLLRATVLVRDRIPGARLFVAGREGTLTDDLLAFVREAGLEHQVTLLGNRPDVPDLLAACDVFAFPSLWEGLPGAAIEAMALEAPVVASDIPGVRDVVGTHAYLVPPDDAAKLAEGICAALEGGGQTSENVRLCRQRFEKKFQAAVMLEGMEQLYRRLASLPAPPTRRS
jgi:glycosyltransferase involved in cell wall biosynthesis